MKETSINARVLFVLWLSSQEESSYSSNYLRGIYEGFHIGLNQKFEDCPYEFDQKDAESYTRGALIALRMLEKIGLLKRN